MMAACKKNQITGQWSCLLAGDVQGKGPPWQDRSIQALLQMLAEVRVARLTWKQAW